MNVVKEAIESLKGICQIESRLGQGTRFTIRLPLTLAIFNGLVVSVGGVPYILATSDVERVLSLSKHPIREVSECGDRVIDLGEEVLPLVDLRRVFKGNPSSDKGTLVIVRAGGDRCGLWVDDVLTQQRVVHKSLGPEASRSLKGASGATILSDGTAALILDVKTLIPSSEPNGKKAA